MKEVCIKLPKTHTDGEGKELPFPYSGTVNLRILRPKERAQLNREMSFTTDDSGEIVADDNFLNQITKMIDLVQESVVSMEVIKGTSVFTSFDDLDYDEDIYTLYNFLGGKLLRGINLGND